MDIFNVVTSSINSLKRNPKLLLPSFILVIFAVVVMAALSGLFLRAIPGQVTSNHQLYSRLVLAVTSIAPVLILFAFIVFLAVVLVKGMYIDLSYNLRKFPKRPSLRHSFRMAMFRYKDLLEFEVIVAIVYLVLVLILLGPLFLLAQGSIIIPYLNGLAITSSALFSFLLAALVLIAVFAVLSLAALILLWLGPCVVVLDGKGAKEALMASVSIGKKEPLRIFGILVIAYLISAAAMLVSRWLQAIPVLGVIISFIIGIGVMSFIELIAPMYYLAFHKK